jgi:hypothetical protein
MDFFRKGNFQTLFYNEQQYFRLEYTDELAYYEWWTFSEDQINKIKDDQFIDILESEFSKDFSHLKYDPFKNSN